MWHPASFLLSWIGFALVLQWVSMNWLIGFAVLGLLLAVQFAPARCRDLLWRSRWLFLSLAVIFLFLTPGEYLPGIAGQLGLTFEGLEQAGVQLGRLFAMLVSLALLHEQVGTSGLVGGLYWLMRPFPRREMTAVRLMLVLEIVEQKRPIAWREWLEPKEMDARIPELFRLEMPALRLRDMVLLGGLLVTILLVVWR